MWVGLFRDEVGDRRLSVLSLVQARAAGAVPFFAGDLVEFGSAAPAARVVAALGAFVPCLGSGGLLGAAGLASGGSGGSRDADVAQAAGVDALGGGDVAAPGADDEAGLEVDEARDFARSFVSEPHPEPSEVLKTLGMAYLKTVTGRKPLDA